MFFYSGFPVFGVCFSKLLEFARRVYVCVHACITSNSQETCICVCVCVCVCVCMLVSVTSISGGVCLCVSVCDI